MLRVGIAGYGIVGKRREKAVNSHPGLQLVGVCDRVFTACSIREDGVKILPSYLQLLEESLDILLVCMTNDIAAEVTIAGLRAGLHVFCEKPPGRDVDDIARVIAVERDCKPQKLMYGFNHRYHLSVREARDVMKRREFGRLIGMRGVYGKSRIITFNQGEWRTQRACAGGGVLLDQGIHMLDLMRLFAGEFVEVKSFVSNDFWKFDVEDNAYALLKTASGIVAMMQSSATQWRHRFQLELNCERGSVILGGILSGTKSYGAETLTLVWASPETDGGDPKEQTTRYNVDPSWEAEIDEFIECIVHNRKVVNGSSWDAFKTMELVYRIYEADPLWKAKYGISATPSAMMPSVPKPSANLELK